jgi:uncharacterized membrane protein YphA (DoxX/SURF4 family)
MRIRPTEVFAFLARLAIGGVLLYAGFLKAVAPSAEFAAILAAYKLFPPAWLTPMSLALPYVEMWVGLFLITGFCTRWAAFLSLLLSIGFMVSVGAALYRGIDLAACGCFGAQSFTPRHTFGLDIGLFILSLFVFQMSKLPPLLSLDRAIP